MALTGALNVLFLLNYVSTLVACKMSCVKRVISDEADSHDIIDQLSIG